MKRKMTGSANGAYADLSRGDAEDDAERRTEQRGNSERQRLGHPEHDHQREHRPTRCAAGASALGMNRIASASSGPTTRPNAWRRRLKVSSPGEYVSVVMRQTLWVRTGAE